MNLRRIKTDKADAEMICKYAQSHELKAYNKKTILDLTNQINKLEKELKKLVESNESDLFSRLQTIPGIGKTTAMFMIVMSDGFKRKKRN